MSYSIPRYGHRHRLRVGLLGGSFNPAHEGHLHVARQAMTHLRLDQLWLMVSPGNPLKPTNGMAPFAQRLASAENIADGRRIIATDIEQRLGTRYTKDTMRALTRRFPAQTIRLADGGGQSVAAAALGPLAADHARHADAGAAAPRRHAPGSGRSGRGALQKASPSRALWAMSARGGGTLLDSAPGQGESGLRHRFAPED